MTRQGKGFITVACNTKDINYLENAYWLATSIKDTQKTNSISVITTKESVANTELKYQKYFDNILLIENTTNYNAETTVWHKSPYKQTIKVEADCIFPTSIDHWWEVLDQKDVVLTHKIMTYFNTIITNRSQRKLFDDNNLPDVYSALYYFRYSLESKSFFSLVKNIFDNWQWFRDNLLKNCRYEYPVTDEVFALAAKIYGIEKCTISGSVPSFVHMKNQLQNLPNDDHWWNYVYFEKSNKSFNIGHIKQTMPLHYKTKSFTTVLRNHYE